MNTDSEQQQGDRQPATTCAFADVLSRRILTWCITEPNRGPKQRRDLALIIQEALNNIPSAPVSGIEAQVCDDVAARQIKGVAKYGVTVADNPLALKDWLQHAYEEALDQAIYLKRAIREIE